MHRAESLTCELPCQNKHASQHGRAFHTCKHEHPPRGGRGGFTTWIRNLPCEFETRPSNAKLGLEACLFEFGTWLPNLKGRAESKTSTTCSNSTFRVKPRSREISIAWPGLDFSCFELSASFELGAGFGLAVSFPRRASPPAPPLLPLLGDAQSAY